MQMDEKQNESMKYVFDIISVCFNNNKPDVQVSLHIGIVYTFIREL